MGKKADAMNEGEENKLTKKERKEFNKAATHFAIRNDLDPKALEEAYRGRKRMLVARYDQNNSHELGGGLLAGAAGLATFFTAFGIMLESTTSFNNDGPLNNLLIGAPIIGGLSLLSAWQFGKRKKVDAKVKDDIQKFADNPQAMLPPPSKEKETKALPAPQPGKPGLI
jgi:hypothetical protein